MVDTKKPATCGDGSFGLKMQSQTGSLTANA